ncbi:hypothetical protein SAY87_018771 [Trapa incisa]|uniref:Uncharacterized protein n=1 Tax=Trapa incisa TaxID=236973 RepID=A0AAN7JYR1_9MYRT|nr:hypothetical protein SAY87_018771 [Trapa incisa]
MADRGSNQTSWRENENNDPRDLDDPLGEVVRRYNKYADGAEPSLPEISCDVDGDCACIRVRCVDKPVVVSGVCSDLEKYNIHLDSMESSTSEDQTCSMVLNVRCTGLRPDHILAEMTMEDIFDYVVEKIRSNVQ